MFNMSTMMKVTWIDICTYNHAMPMIEYVQNNEFMIQLQSHLITNDTYDSKCSHGCSHKMSVFSVMQSSYTHVICL